MICGHNRWAASEAVQSCCRAGTDRRSLSHEGNGMELEQAIGDYLDWLATTRTMSAHTLRAYRGDLAAATREIGSATAVETLNTEALLAFIAAQRERGLAASTVRRRASALRGFCGWLNRMGELAGDPWRDAGISIRQPKRLPRPACSDSVRSLMTSLCQAADVSRVAVPVGPFTRPFQANTLVAVALMLATGIRVGEVTTLRCHDFDAEARSLRVTGKGARERHVYVSGWVVGLIGAQLKTRRMLGVDHDLLLFNRCRGVMSSAAVRARMRGAARSADMNAHITPHMLRHTTATQLVDRGVDIRFVQRLLGHASLTTTEQYTQVNDATLRRVVTEADLVGHALR